MAIKTRYAGIVVLILTPILLAINTYVIESFMINEGTPHPLKQIYLYFVYHLIFRLYLFLPAFWLYQLIFRRVSIPYRVGGFLYAILIAYVYATKVFTNDISLDRIIDDSILIPINYCITAFIIWSIYEFLRIERSME